MNRISNMEVVHALAETWTKMAKPEEGWTKKQGGPKKGSGPGGWTTRKKSLPKDVKYWPRGSKDTFYTVVKALNAWDRENAPGGRSSPLNGWVAEAVARAENGEG